MRVTEREGLCPLQNCSDYVFFLFCFQFGFVSFVPVSEFNPPVLWNIRLVIPHLLQKKKIVFHWVSNMNHLRKDFNVCGGSGNQQTKAGAREGRRRKKVG